MGEWVRFFITAALLIGGLLCFLSGVCGAYRFGFVMNRMHAGGIGDTLGLLLVITALAVSGGEALDTLKLFMIVAFMWFTSPVSTHFLGQVEYNTNRHLYSHVERLLEEGSADGGEKVERG